MVDFEQFTLLLITEWTNVQRHDDYGLPQIKHLLLNFEPCFKKHNHLCYAEAARNSEGAFPYASLKHRVKYEAELNPV